MSRPTVVAILALLVAVPLVARPTHAQAEAPFRDGKFAAQARTYLATTRNDGSLQDWYALAIGGRLGYHTAPVHGIGGGVTAYASRALVGNTDKVDPATQRPSRYELGLYNIEEPKDREVALFGEAYVDYHQAAHEFWAGRHLLKTPLLNPQDGRMVPTLAQGVWYSYTAEDGLGLNIGYLTHIAARSTERFRSVRNTLGLYPSGKNPDGTPSDYAGHTQSLGLAIGGLTYKRDILSANLWDYHTENVFNALYGDAYLEPRLVGLNWRIGAQYVGEFKVGDGGSATPTEAYFQDANAQAFGGQVQVSTRSRWMLSANYNRITASGRFLFPREWGREPLFVFQKRERSEGAGDLHAFLAEVGKRWGSPAEGQLSTKLGYGHYYLPDPNSPELNKYGMPSYRQVNLDTFFDFGSSLEGLSIELLVAYKGALGNRPTIPGLLLNKVEMLHGNLIANYTF